MTDTDIAAVLDVDAMQPAELHILLWILSNGKPQLVPSVAQGRLPALEACSLQIISG
jgi:hypothetical protein